MTRWTLAIAMSVGLAVVGADGIVARAGSERDPMDAGDAFVVTALDQTRLLTEGDSTTVFSLRLPANAACPGDSANDDWRVQSFVVPAADDIGALTYLGIGPEGEGRWALYGVDTDPYYHELTAPNETAGQPGAIMPLPPLSFAVFPPGALSDGPHRIGVACTFLGETASFWDAEISFSGSSVAGGLQWEVVAREVMDPESRSGGATGLWAIGFAGVVVALGVAVAVRRRSVRAGLSAREA